MATTTQRQRRSPEEWEQVARELIPEIQSGTPISGLMDRFGSNTDAVRVALANLGVDPRTGGEIKLNKISASTPKALARQVYNRRMRGEPWWKIIAEADRPYSVLRATLTEQGLWDEAHGRKSRDAA